MFETAELGHKLSKDEYDARVPKLRMSLLDAQSDLKEARFSTLILIGGLDGAGKGETVNLLHEWMDPRYLETHAFGPPTDEELERPEFWRFWRALPPHGRIGILFGSWYTRPIQQRVRRRATEAELDAALGRINKFEKELTDNGTLIVKLWFHLSRKAQKQRLETLAGDPRTRWRVGKEEWRHLKRYGAFRDIAERSVRETNTRSAPWLIVEGADHRHRSVVVGEHLLHCLQQRLRGERARARPAPPPAPRRRNPKTLLDNLDLSREVGEKRYEKELERLQGRLNLLSRKAKNAGLSTILVFEGWDAAGKGGIIRRLTGAMDARDYHVIPIAAPTDEERAHHYLWRFWRHLPRAGRVTLFDRSWYGRVLVERVEGFATTHEWRRAYGEIVAFEQQLHEHGIRLLKFWVHIDKEEQLRRFRERQQTPFKRHKITDEDFRNRRRWNDYERAAEEMLQRTGTEFAPWTLVEGNDKRYARIKVLKTVCRRLEEA
jgi:polyphosphate:AMP phosphotransferase